MVLEEFLDFYREDSADAFVRFLKSKGCPATKMHRDIHSESYVIHGEIGNMIAMFKEVAQYEKSVSAKPPLDIDSLARLMSDPRVSPGEQSLHSSLIKSSLNATNLILHKKIRDSVAECMARYTIGDQIASSQEIASIFTRVADQMENDPHEEVREEYKKALFLVSKYQCMQENGLITIDPAVITLVKKTDPETISVMQVVPDPDMYDEDMLAKYRIILYRSIFLKTSTCVALDPRVHFTFSPKDIGKALVGLAADEKSVEQLFINMFFKQYVIGRITGIVKNAKTISLDNLLLVMTKDTHEKEWRDCPTTIDASRDYIVGILTQMRKNKIITGSNEKMRLA